MKSKIEKLTIACIVCLLQAKESRARESGTIEEVAYQLYFDTNWAQLLLHTTQSYALMLKPEWSKVNSSEASSVQVKLNCESDGNNSFSWNSTESNCTVLKLVDDIYNFTMITPNESTINLTLQALQPGKQQLVAHARFRYAQATNNSYKIDVTKAYLTVNVGRSATIVVMSNMVGWIYFVAWSISFYPQIWQNFRRRSVTGLNFDFVALNITGFVSYSVYNIAFKYNRKVQNEFYRRYPKSQIPVETNDVVFGAHATFATLIIIFQCFTYERGNQKIANWSKISLSALYGAYIVLGTLVTFTNLISLLDYIYIYSYVKLVITIIKYFPQAWYNFRRKSTVGWSIENILLDFTGGSFSIFQMCLLAYNYDDWLGITTNVSKLGLGVFSILFDVLFITQHYILYRKRTTQAIGANQSTYGTVDCQTTHQATN